MAGCGLEFAYLSVRPEALARASGDAALARAHGYCDVCVFAWDPVDADRAYPGVLSRDTGVPEDPATGSAALGFGVWLVASGLLPADGESAYTVIRRAWRWGGRRRWTCTVRRTGERGHGDGDGRWYRSVRHEPSRGLGAAVEAPAAVRS